MLRTYLSAKARRFKQFYQFLLALYHASSVIKLEPNESHLRVILAKGVLLEVNGHLVTFAHGQIVRQAQVVHDQPGVTKEDLTEPLAAVEQSLRIHRQQLLRLQMQSTGHTCSLSVEEPIHARSLQRSEPVQ